MANPKNGNEIGNRSNEYELIPIKIRPSIGDQKHGKMFFKRVIKKSEVINDE